MAFTIGKVKGNYTDIMFGDGADPEQFTQLCGINSKGLTINYSTAFETTDWDCADPEAKAQTVRDVGAQDWSITGSGLFNRSQMAALRDLHGATNNWRFNQDEPAGDSLDDGYWQGPGYISNWQETGNNGEYKQISLTITGAGLLSWADAG
jgi:hypothetical protein